MNRYFFHFLFLLFGVVNPFTSRGQCDQIAFNFEQYEPCRFRLNYDNSTECYTEIQLVLEQGQFASWNVIPNSNFLVQQISPSELTITHTGGFLPLGSQVPLIFTLPVDLVTNVGVYFLNDCPPAAYCILIPSPVLESCPDPQDASIFGVKYRECGSLPYTNQPTISGWTIQLLNTDGNVVAEQVTDAGGAYGFYGLHSGTYTVKEIQQPGWSPKVPASGQATIVLNPSEQKERNFGNCPACSCDSIYMDVVQLPGLLDSCTYDLNVSNTGAYCFNEINISLNSGIFASVTPSSGWDVMVIDSQHVQFKKITNGAWINVVHKMSLIGAATHEMTVSTFYNTGMGNVICSRSFSYQCPPPPPLTPCCPAGSSFGNEQVLNRDFQLGNQDFTNDYTYFSPGGPTKIGYYSVLDCCLVISAYHLWFANDRTLIGGKMLIVDGYNGPIAWQQTVNVTAGTTYAYSAWFNNLIKPLNNYDDPQMVLFVGNSQIAGPLNLPEAPDRWARLCGSWTATTTGPVVLSIQMLSTANIGNDVAIDDISFRACLPPPTCSVAATAVKKDNCGSVELTATATGLAPFTYQWSNFQTSPVINIQQPCGTSTYTVTVTCADNSTSTAKVTVVFTDNTLPTVTCPGNLSVQGFIDAQGFCSSFVNNIGATATDNCAGPSLTYNISLPTGGSGSNDASGTVFKQGTSIVTYSATDWCGNKASCSLSVTVECHNCNCPGTLGSELVTNGNFNSLTPISSSYNYDCTLQQPGFYCVTTNPALVNAGYVPCVDVSGTGGMLVANGSSPSTEIWCQVFNSLTPNTNYIFTYWVASVSAASPAQIQLYLNNAPYGSLGQAIASPCLWRQYCQVWNSGNNTSVTLCLKDVNTTAAGNDFALDEISFRACSTPPPCQASFTITPINNCGLVQLTSTSTGPPTIGHQWYNSVSTPNQQVQLSCGLNTICVTVTCGDGSTSTACQNYVVADPIPPVALCKLPISMDLDPNCTFQVTPAFVDNGSSDNCPNFTMMVSPTVLPSCAITTVTLTVTDWCNNTSTCTMDIQTAESTPPVINNCPQNQTVPMDPGMCFYTFIPPALSVTDNCDPNPVLNCTWEDPNGTILPLTEPVQMPKGTNKIRCKAIDNCDNESAPCNYAITVGDYESPMIICPQNLTIQGVFSNNKCEAVVNNIAPIVTDNCPIQSLNYYISPSGNTGANDASGGIFPQGTSTVAYVVTDCGGFTNACFFTVTVDCDCGSTCLTNSVNISTGHQDQAAAGILVPGHINQNWRLKSAPSGSGLTNFDFPGHMLKHSSWTTLGSTWMSAYLFNDQAPLNGTPGVGVPFVYERKFCVCEDGNVNFNFEFWSDDCGTVELIDPLNIISPVTLVDNCAFPNVPDNWSTLTPSLSPSQPYFLLKGSYILRISHWNTIGQPMGVNLSGTITGSNLEKDECCDPQEACFLVRKFENVPNGQPYYEWDQSNDWTSYDKPLSGWYFNISNGTNSYGPFGPSDILGEVLVCNLPVGLPGPFYSTTEVIQPGWTITYSNSQPSTLVDHHVQIMEFGNSKDNGCGCGTLSNLVATPTLVGGQSIPLTCGGSPVNLNWPIGSDIYITGKLQCQGTCLPTEWVSFSLTTPNGSAYVGGAQSSPYFAIGLLPVWCSSPGLYTLTLKGYCGGNPCTPCVIQFQIGNPDPCPCDPIDFQSDLSQGFAVSYAITGCVTCFTPIALNDCDIVHWSFNGGPIVGTTFGNQTFCYNFTAGTHTVMMTVARKDGQGNKCDQGSFTQSVNITCGIKVACGVSNFPNPGFSEGPNAGGINSTGTSTGWYGPCLEPVVVSGEPGSHDGWTIQLTGNLDSADVLAPRDSICIPLDTGTIFLRFGIKEKGIKSTLHIQLYQGPEFEMNECDGSACIELAAIDLTPLNTGWQDLELPYDIREWTAVSGFACTGGVKARVAIFVTTAIGGDQGSYAETRSSIQLDNFCMGDGIVSVKNTPGRAPLRIFPNPNPGSFTVELPEAATSDISLRIVGLTGQALGEQNTQSGNRMQLVQARDLPAGLYFLQVVSDGKVLAVEKFVKQ